jgi:hypothetical protein
MDDQSIGLTIELLSIDQDVVELWVRCESDWFAGTVQCYAGLGVFRDLAEAWRGFPESRDDVRDFTIGNMNPTFPDGGVEMRLQCVDSRGHAALHVIIQNDGRLGRESAEFCFPFEAAALDEFINQLERGRLIEGHVIRFWRQRAGS